MNLLDIIKRYPNKITLRPTLREVIGYPNSYARNEAGQIIALHLFSEKGTEGGNFEFQNLEKIVLDENAQYVEFLCLSNNQQLKEVIFTTALPFLTHLYLNDCSLKNITIPEGCKSLKQLYLQAKSSSSKGILEKITFQGDCPNLELLDISNNQVKEIIFDKQLLNEKNVFSKLKYVYLFDNQLKELPEMWVWLPNIETILAHGNAPNNIPKAFLGEKERDNCLTDAQIWFSELRDYASETNKVVKLMLLGNGNAGKSSIYCALQAGQCDHDHRSTHGIQIGTLSKAGVTYNVWDFGGQEVYHGTHRLFMASEGVQVLVFDPITEGVARSGKPIKDRISEDEIINHPLPYWYETAHELSPNSRFVVAQNKKDAPDCETEDPEARKYAQTWKSDFVQVSARTGENIDDLAYYMGKRAKELPDFGMKMPKSWLEVRQFFIDNMEKGNHGGESIKTITKTYFFDRLCKNVQEKAKPLLFKYLRHNGFLYYHESLGDVIIADQRWALAAIYKPLDRTAEHYEELRGDGKVRVYRLFSIFGNEYTDAQKWLFLDFMKSCGLCFQLNNKPEGEARKSTDVYVFPELLPFEQPQKVTNRWERAHNVQYLRYRFEWVNYFVIQSFIAALGRKTETHNIWRNGIFIETQDGWFKVALDYEQKALLIQIEEKALSNWLKSITETLNVSDKKQWEISANGIDFQYFDPENWKPFVPEMPFGKKVLGIKETKTDETRAETDHRKLPERLPDVPQQYDKKVILFLAANPTAERLSFGEEFKHIFAKLTEKDIKHKFEIRLNEGTTLDKMLGSIDDIQPEILHFAGHGKEVNPDEPRSGGLAFHNSDYQGEKVLDAQKIKSIFNRLKNKPKHQNLKIVLFNACYSEPQAKALSECKLYAIGTSDKITSPAARTFAAGFYRKYAHCENVEEAVDSGLTLALGEDIDIEELIHLYHNGKEITI